MKFTCCWIDGWRLGWRACRVPTRLLRVQHVCRHMHMCAWMHALRARMCGRAMCASVGVLLDVRAFLKMPHRDPRSRRAAVPSPSPAPPRTIARWPPPPVQSLPLPRTGGPSPSRRLCRPRSLPRRERTAPFGLAGADASRLTITPTLTSCDAPSPSLPSAIVCVIARPSLHYPYHHCHRTEPCQLLSRLTISPLVTWNGHHLIRFSRRRLTRLVG